MLTEVKNQLKVTLLSVKYALVREMLNKTTFITNVVFMILNNACMIFQWIILFSLKDNFGGYTFKMVILLWGIASATYGFSHFFFKNAYKLSNTINLGKLDSYLVQPKNVLISCITSDITTSALGDIIYGYIMLLIYGINLKSFILFTFFIICGGLMLTSISVILNSLSFWFQKTDVLADIGMSIMTNVATYPDGIFKGVTKILLYTIVPIGIVNYIPIQVITDFNINLLLVTVFATILLIILAFITFNKGLKRYSSSNLMIARI